jgi:hypothetical protein
MREEKLLYLYGNTSFIYFINDVIKEKILKSSSGQFGFMKTTGPLYECLHYLDPYNIKPFLHGNYLMMGKNTVYIEKINIACDNIKGQYKLATSKDRALFNNEFVAGMRYLRITHVKPFYINYYISYASKKIKTLKILMCRASNRFSVIAWGISSLYILKN